MNITSKNVKIVLLSLYNKRAIGIRQISSFLKSHGYKTKLVFFKEMLKKGYSPPKEEEIKKLISLLEKINPDIIGISLTSPFFKTAVEITKRIKEKTDSLIVWGGIHPTIEPNECIRYTDIVCVGEGEKPMLELVEKIKMNGKITSIKNLWINDGNRIEKNEIRELNDLDSLPPLDYEAESFFICAEKIEAKNIYNYGTYCSKGCPFSCTYCVEHVLRKMYRGKGKYVRRKSVENVINDLLEAKKKFKNMKSVYFWDGSFVNDKKWINRFSIEYRKKIKLPFNISYDSRSFDEEILQMLKKSGLRSVELGIQTGNEKIKAEIYNRHETNEDIEKASKLLHKYGIKCFYLLILDNPYEKNKELLDTLNLLLKIPPPFMLMTYSLTFFPKCEITEKLLKDKIIYKNQVEGLNQKTFKNWRMKFDSLRSKKHAFLYSLILLTGIGFVPRSLIKRLSKSNMLIKTPTFLLRFVHFFKNIYDYIKWQSLMVWFLYEP